MPDITFHCRGFHLGFIADAGIVIIIPIYHTLAVRIIWTWYKGE
jgi:hypothetical protein